MQIPKPSEADKDRFRSLMPDAAGVEVKAMFGNLGAFVNGNMFAGLFGPTVGVKFLDAASSDAFAAIEGVGPFGPSQRPMAGYLTLPPAWAGDPALAARGWNGSWRRSPRCRPRWPKRPSPGPRRSRRTGEHC
jgi:hypothetical protein